MVEAAAAVVRGSGERRSVGWMIRRGWQGGYGDNTHHSQYSTLLVGERAMVGVSGRSIQPCRVAKGSSSVLRES